MPIQTKHPEYERVLPYITKTEDAFRGEVVDYVPKRESLSPTQNEKFRNRSSYYNVTERTLTALVGALTRKPASIEGVEDIHTADGSSFNEMLNTLYSDLLSTGKVGILVDYSDEMGTPYLTPYNGLNIINWCEDYIVLQEHYYAPDPDDRYTIQQKIRFRELTFDEGGQYIVNIWEMTAKDTWELKETHEPMMRGRRLPYIPFVAINPWDTSNACYKPPLATLADINVEHFILQTCLAHVAWVLSSPTPVITGELQGDAQVIGLGGDKFIHLREGGSASFLEFSGNNVNFLMDMVKEKETQMFSFGSRLLQYKNGVESTEALQIRLGAESSSLGQIKEVMEQGITQALAYYTQWERPEASTVEVHLNKDFSPVGLTPEQIRSLLELYTSGSITLEDFQRHLYEGEIIQEMGTESQRAGEST